MAIDVFNRHEQKYILTREDFENVTNMINDRMELDSHNKKYGMYSISDILKEKQINKNKLYIVVFVIEKVKMFICVC